MIEFIILNFGYVESSYPFSWIFTHHNGFNSKFEAAKALAEEYFSIYKEKYIENESGLSRCCNEFKQSTYYDANSMHYCPKCRSNLDKVSFFVDEYRNWLMQSSLHNHDESDLSKHFDNSLFCPFNPPYGITEQNSLYIGNADKILIALLYDDKNEEKLFDKNTNEHIYDALFFQTTFEKFKKSFESTDGPNLYG